MTIGKGNIGIKKTEKVSLSRELILHSALAILDSDGLEGLTIRKLASSLSVTPMAVYRHYKNKTEIEDELVDLVIGDYDVTNHQEENWREWLLAAYLLMYQGLCEHPGIIPLLNGAIYKGGSALAVMDKILDVLCQAGLSNEQSAQLFHIAMAYTIGTAVLMRHDQGLSGTDEDSGKRLRQSKECYEILSGNQYPNVVKLAIRLASFPEDAQFLAGLRQIIWAVDP